MTFTVATLTTRQVLDACGFKSVRTLQRWRERNLVPPPTLQRHPNGRGMTWMWPAWTIRHIAAIKKRLAAGESLDEVGRTLGDWQAEAKRWHPKRYDFKAAFERMQRHEAIDRFAEWASDTVYLFLRDIGVERPGRIDDKVWKSISKSQFIDEVLRLVRLGYAPVMVVTSNALKVVPDFLVSSALGDTEARGGPLLVVPIRHAFVEAFSNIEPKLSNKLKYAPAKYVEERREKKRRIRRYRQKTQWEFDFEK
ncbi:MAG: hypothetical protein WD738_22920 [Pirellulales bacterium]